MNALCAPPQQHFLLQRSIILSLHADKTTPAFTLVCQSTCSLRVLVDAAVSCWYFNLWQTAKCTLLSGSTQHEICVPLSAGRFLVINIFLSMQRNSLDWLSANSSVQHPLSIPLWENFQRCFWQACTQTHTHTHTHTHRQAGREEREWEDVIFLQLSLLSAYMSSPDCHA